MSKIYIALDSDVLRSISYIYYLRKNVEIIDQNLLPEPIKRFSGYLLRILTLSDHGRIEFVILDTVWQENKFFQQVIDFIKEKDCVFADYTGNNRLKKKRIARELAIQYCKPFTTPDGIEHSAPMQEKYDPNIDNFAPTADCYIMAEATIEGLCVLTNNGKDFVFNPNEQSKTRKQDEQGSKKFSNDRSFGISYINQQNGYIFTDPTEPEIENSNFSLPHPFLLHEFGAMLKNFDSVKLPHVENPDFVTFEQSMLDN